MGKCSVTLLLSVIFAHSANCLLASEPRVTTFAGTGEDRYFGDGGPATEAGVGGPFGVVIGPQGDLYVCETTSHAIRLVDAKDGTIHTVAGTGEVGYDGDGGPATEAKVNEPYELCFDELGNLFFVDMRAHVVRRIDARTGIISTVAGNGKQDFGGDGGPATRASLSRPHSICLDGKGHLFICDIGNHRVRRVHLASGDIETYSGTGERSATPDGASVRGTPLNGPRTMIATGDQLLLALREGNAVYRVDTVRATLHHLAGAGRQGYRGDGGPAKRAQLAGPKGIAVGPHGDIYLADTESHTIRVIRAKSKTIETLIGDGQRGDGPDGDPKKCRLDRPHGVYVDEMGNVYIGDSGNHKVRKFVPGN